MVNGENKIKNTKIQFNDIPESIHFNQKSTRTIILSKSETHIYRDVLPRNVRLLQKKIVWCALQILQTCHQF